jgi:hypothetical protein
MMTSSDMKTGVELTSDALCKVNYCLHTAGGCNDSASCVCVQRTVCATDDGIILEPNLVGTFFCISIYRLGT